jgi:hypothetical protein
MKIAIMQPYFFPYIGYFQLINAVDKFIFYDDVNFINKGWINRNRILLNGIDHMFTLALKHASQNKLINQITICKNNDKIIQTIKQAYLKAPYFEDVFPLILQVFGKMNELINISKIAEISVITVSNYLNLSTFFTNSSEKYSHTKNLSREKRLITICQENSADTYINPSGGKVLYTHDNFKEYGIKLFYIKNNINPYKQFSNDFISRLSIIDVMMFNDKKTITKFLNNYELE